MKVRAEWLLFITANACGAAKPHGHSITHEVSTVARTAGTHAQPPSTYGTPVESRASFPNPFPEATAVACLSRDEGSLDLAFASARSVQLAHISNGKLRAGERSSVRRGTPIPLREPLAFVFFDASGHVHLGSSEVGHVVFDEQLRPSARTTEVAIADSFCADLDAPANALRGPIARCRDGSAVVPEIKVGTFDAVLSTKEQLIAWHDPKGSLWFVGDRNAFAQSGREVAILTADARPFAFAYAEIARPSFALIVDAQRRAGPRAIGFERPLTALGGCGDALVALTDQSTTIVSHVRPNEPPPLPLHD